MIRRFIISVCLTIPILTVTCFAAPTIVQQPQDMYLPAGTESGYDVSFTVVAAGEGTLSYQWQLSAADQTSWSNLTGVSATQPTLLLHYASNFDNIVNGQRFFRCIVSDNTGSSVTESVTTRSVGFYISNTMEQLLRFLQQVADSTLSSVSDVATTISTVPLLALSLGFFFIGGVIGIIGRLLRRS